MRAAKSSYCLPKRKRSVAYMDAINKGDMEEARRMVVEGVRKMMPSTKVVDEYSGESDVFRR